jgi:hypothetical protein
MRAERKLDLLCQFTGVPDLRQLCRATFTVLQFERAQILTASSGSAFSKSRREPRVDARIQPATLSAMQALKPSTMLNTQHSTLNTQPYFRISSFDERFERLNRHSGLEEMVNSKLRNMRRVRMRVRK